MKPKNVPLIINRGGRIKEWSITTRSIEGGQRGDYDVLFAVTKDDAQWLNNYTREVDYTDPDHRFLRDKHLSNHVNVIGFVIPDHKEITPITGAIEMFLYSMIAFHFPVIVGAVFNDQVHIGSQFIAMTLYLSYKIPDYLQSLVDYDWGPDHSTREIRCGYSAEMSILMRCILELGDDAPVSLWAQYEEIANAMSAFEMTLDHSKVKTQDEILTLRILELASDILAAEKVALEQADDANEYMKTALLEANKVNEDIADDALNILQQNLWRSNGGLLTEHDDENKYQEKSSLLNRKEGESKEPAKDPCDYEFGSSLLAPKPGYKRYRYRQ